MNWETYRADPSVNWSSLKHIATSPREYRYRAAHPKEETPAMRDGSAAHCAALEPDEFPRRYILWEGGTRRGKAWDEFARVNESKTILTAAEYAKALAIRDAVRANPAAAAIIAACETEVTLQWTDPDTGLPCKARPDLLGGGHLSDLKTTRSIDPRLFQRAASDMDYFGQLGFYAIGAEANGIEVAHVSIIAVEAGEDTPHDNVVFTIPGPALDEGRERARVLLDKLAECMASDSWPGRFTGPEPLDTPPWYSADDSDSDDIVFLGLAPQTRKAS